MAGRFPLFTDEHLRGPLVKGLVRAGWDVARTVDLLDQGTHDEVLFAYAAEHGRVLVTNDEPLPAIAIRWLAEGRRFNGLICWTQDLQKRFSDGDLIRRLEALAAMESPFEPYPVLYITALWPAVQDRARDLAPA